MSDVLGFSMVLAVFTLFVVVTSATENSGDERRDWIEANVEENYSIRDAEVKFPDSVPHSDDDKTTIFTVKGLSDSSHHTIEVEGYLDFDEQVVIIGDDADGAVVPVEGSDAARVLTDSTGV